MLNEKVISISNKEKKRWTPCTLATLNTLEAFGFTIHPDQINLKTINFYWVSWFILDSKDMKITLTKERNENIINAIVDASKKQKNYNYKIWFYYWIYESQLSLQFSMDHHYKYVEKDKTEILRSS